MKNIFVKYHKEMIYTKLGNEHIINNLFKDEISILTIKVNKFYILRCFRFKKEKRKNGTVEIHKK